MAKYDVVKEYDWTSAPRGSGMRKKAPRVWVKSYKIKSNAILNRFKNYYNIATAGDAKTFYDKMYGDSTIAEDDFNFPFFTDTVRSFGNSFSDTNDGSSFIGAVDSAIEGIAKLGATAVTMAGGDNIKNVGNALVAGDFGKAKDIVGNFLKTGGAGSDPGAYIETPKLYQYDSTSDSALEVSFVISNTINNDYDKNHKLVQRLTYINRPLRKNGIAVDPPRIYQVKVPGHRFIRWAYCSNFSVSLLGTKREINGVIVPEAYQISMAFQSLTMEHAGFLKEA